MPFLSFFDSSYALRWEQHWPGFGGKKPVEVGSLRFNRFQEENVVLEVDVPMKVEFKFLDAGVEHSVTRAGTVGKSEIRC